jgi:ElaB/YqjD/DUF883 family membrane-anchored ribosome-binding protein
MPRTDAEAASDSVTRLAKAAGVNREKLSRDLAALKASFVNLRDEVSSILANAFQVDDKRVLPTRHEVSTQLEQARHREAIEQKTHTDAVSRITQKVRENPVASAAVAFGVGFAISKLLTPRPKQRPGRRE